MQIILNYKSYFEAFRLGVVNNGFKPVAEVLFYPLFRSHTLLDAKLVPYEVNSQNASRWGNGQDLIQKEIQDAVGTDETLNQLLDYFTKTVVPHELSPALKDEMLDAMQELVRDCENLRDTKKKQLLKYYESGQIGEFLARVFQRALLANNKVTASKERKSASDESSQSLDEFNKLIKGKLKKPKTVVPEEIRTDELPYVSQLYRAYGKTCNAEVKDRTDLVALHYKDHFEQQRKTYYMAETIHHEIRDSIRPDEEDCFDVLKDEIEQGIFQTSRKPYADPVSKVDAVMERASIVPISQNMAAITYNWIGAGEKQGVCNMLVNDERLKWVDDDE